MLHCRNAICIPPFFSHGNLIKLIIFCCIYKEIFKWNWYLFILLFINSFIFIVCASKEYDVIRWIGEWTNEWMDVTTLHIIQIFNGIYVLKIKQIINQSIFFFFIKSWIGSSDRISWKLMKESWSAFTQACSGITFWPQDSRVYLLL